MKKVEPGMIVRLGEYAYTVYSIEGNKARFCDEFGFTAPLSEITFLPSKEEVSELYREGWNARVEDANTKLPRRSKKSLDFILGFYDCDTHFNKSIVESLATRTNPVYPGKI